MTRKFEARKNKTTQVIEYTTWTLCPGDTVIVPVHMTAQRHIGAAFVFDGIRLQIVGRQAYTRALVCEVLAESPEVF
jgi:hypothetical protein